MQREISFENNKKRIGIIAIAILLLLCVQMIRVAFSNSGLEDESLFWCQSVDHGKAYKLVIHNSQGTEEIDIPTSLHRASHLGDGRYLGYMVQLPDSAPGEEYDAAIGIIDVRTGTVEEIIHYTDFEKTEGGMGGQNQYFFCSEDEERVYFHNFSNWICRYDRVGEELEKLYKTTGDCFFLTRDEDHLYYTGDDNQSIVRIDMETNDEELIEIKTRSFTVSSDEEKIAYIDYDDQYLYLYDCVTKNKQRIGKQATWMMGFSGDDRYIFYACPKEVVIPGNTKTTLYVYDLNERKTHKIYSTYSTMLGINWN